MKISVIIPAYNCEQYIGRCIDSLFVQNGAEMEIIVVNDGSTDRTVDVLSLYTDRIILKNIQNSGAANARNVGLSCATGDFVMFLDADDYFKSGTIEKLIEKQREYDADIVRFRYECVYPNHTVNAPGCQIDREWFAEKNEFPQKIYPMFFRGIYLNSVCMSMYRRSVIEDIRFRTDMITAEDAVFSLAVFHHATNVLFIPDILYEYYQTNEGLTGKGISVFRKYKDNFTFAAVTMRYLKKWKMNTASNYFKVLFRPVLLTFDKIKRLSDAK